MHTLTRESQEVMVGLNDLHTDVVVDGDEAARIIRV
jgi:hypothetical protein